jgi:tetratricopeptide (TPR) repeat protein
VKRHVVSLLLVALSLPGLAAAQPAPPAATTPAGGPKPAAPAAVAGRPAGAPAAAGAKSPTAVNPATQDLAQRAIAAAQKDNYDEALKLFREAYRIDTNPRWLYNMGVLYDRMANCDDAAFFYRAAIYGKGVLPQDVEAVDNRLAVLQDECNFKEKHKLAENRHERAARYIKDKLCTLSEAILTGIITPAERQAVEACKAETAKTQAAAGQPGVK